MRKNKKQIWTNTFIWNIICALAGVAVCIIILILFSVMLYNITDVIKSFTVFSSASLIAGTYCGGYICGLFRRKNGLYEGLFCGFTAYMLLLVAGGIYFHSFAHLISIRKFIMCVIPSAIGGIIGVNHKRPKKLRD